MLLLVLRRGSMHIATFAFNMHNNIRGVLRLYAFSVRFISFSLPNTRTHFAHVAMRTAGVWVWGHSRYFVYLLKYFMTSISNVQSAINPKMKTKMKILVRSLTWCCTRIRTHHRINEKMFIFVCHCNRGVVKARRNATRNHHHHHYHFIMSSDLSSLVSLDRYFKLKV